MKTWIKKYVLTLVLVFAAMILSLVPTQNLEAASPYTVSVNVTANVITVYYGDTPIRALTCSTGADTPRKGTRYLREKYRWKSLYHNSYGQYCTRYDDHMLFHSVPYMRDGDPSSLSGGLFDKLGTPDSMGCIRLLCGDAKWFYDTIPSGTKVTFYCDSENPGPLGFPYCSSRRGIHMGGGYDPTDPGEETDWNRYYQSAFDPCYYLAKNPQLLELDSYWTEATLKLHWVMEGMHQGLVASAYFNVNTYKEQHPEIQDEYKDELFRYVLQYNSDVNKGINVPTTWIDAQEGRLVTSTVPTEDGGTLTLTKSVDGTVSRIETAADGTITATLTYMDDYGIVKTVPAVVKTPEPEQTPTDMTQSAAQQTTTDMTQPAAQQTTADSQAQ